MFECLKGFAQHFDPPVRGGVEATAVQAAPASVELTVRSSALDFNENLAAADRAAREFKQSVDE